MLYSIEWSAWDVYSKNPEAEYLVTNKWDLASKNNLGLRK